MPKLAGSFSCQRNQREEIAGDCRHDSFGVPQQTNRWAKHQTPSFREVPNLKPQTPKTGAEADGAQVGY